MDADLITLVLSLFLTAVIYMAFPFIYMMINIEKNDGRFEKKKARKIALWNSIIVGFLFSILAALAGVRWRATPAIIYYWINCAILTDKSKG